MSAQPQGFTQGSVRAGTVDHGGDGRRSHQKPFFMTSEFLTLALLTAAILIAAAIDDDFGASLAWPLIAVLGFAYIISRGLTKHGTRDRL